MTLKIENSALLAWFQRQQTPPGWFDLLTIMIDAMVDNAGEQESRPFLLQIGNTLAQRYPLKASETLSELENNINQQLSQFGWGCVEINATDNALTLHHQALPISHVQDEAQQHRWCNAFCAILEGAYACWLQQQGGEAYVIVTRDSVQSLSEIHFRYHNPQ